MEKDRLGWVGLG